jgi:hypothetical protein
VCALYVKVLDGHARLYVCVTPITYVCVGRLARMCISMHYADTRKISDRMCVRIARVCMCWLPRVFIGVGRPRAFECVCALRANICVGRRSRMYKCALRSHMYVLHTTRVSMCVRALRVCIFWTPLVYVRVCALLVCV